MHPELILIPAAGLILGPRMWVGHVLEQYDGEEELPLSAKELARELLDRHGLHAVKVELTDRGDHFDPEARSVRLSRHHFDRKSVTVVTTAAHKVAHALQHASGYGSFTWRSRPSWTPAFGARCPCCRTAISATSTWRARIGCLLPVR